MSWAFPAGAAQKGRGSRRGIPDPARRLDGRSAQEGLAAEWPFADLLPDAASRPADEASGNGYSACVVGAQPAPSDLTAGEISTIAAMLHSVLSMMKRL